MEIQREIQVICGAVRIPNLPGFLKIITTIASENKVTIQGLNADLIAGERHLHFAVGKALRAVAAGSNVAKDPGIEIMRYAAGERQIERSFSIGLHEGENNAIFVLLGKMDDVILAFSEIRKLIEEKPCSELLAYSSYKRKGILSLFRITDAEIEASGEERIPELVIERVALADFLK
ncbi:MULTISPECIES: KEOPS complex subunit Cgi121 [unclassified Methanosarcina]|jgi:KEOPS complex subunit Cgi121|uniref:KEOPS complex subunit Cgi121 n=1 Tax=unclassified Methanosarcina TaxID=2644672 RepID=UPI001F43A8EA|nr:MULTISPECIES: KEOPS complex subunit Cgi121 [unclassified Methanosarcina]